jgi:RNA polymerase sigma factor (sigma-70 family)
VNEPHDELIPTRQSLLCRLRDWEDQESWREFFHSYWKLIYSVAIRAGLGDAEAQDIVQETILSVAKRMPDFRYDPALGSFKSWLLLITRRRIADHLRKRGREPAWAAPTSGETGRTAAIDRIPAPPPQDLGVIWDEEWENNLLRTALDRVRQKVDPKQFQIFDCYVLKNWPVRDVTKMLKVTAGQVYLAKHRISTLLKKETQRLEKQASEID